MARQHGGRKLSSFTHSLLRHGDHRTGIDHVEGMLPDPIAPDPGRSPSAAPPRRERAPGDPVPLSGTCSCGRERTGVTMPGIVGDRWFRNVFTQCECGEVLMLTIGEATGPGAPRR